MNFGPPPPQYPLKTFVFPFRRRRKKQGFDFHDTRSHDSSIHTRGVDNSRALDLLLTFRGSQSAIKCFRRHVVSHIQRWNIDPTDGFFLKLLGWIIPTHFNFLYKVNGDTIFTSLQISKISHTQTLLTFSKIQIIPTLFLSWDIFETSSPMYHRLSYTLFSADLRFLKHMLFSLAALLDHSFLLFFIFRIQSFYFRFVQMGRFESLVDSPSKIELFKEKYHIP